MTCPCGSSQTFQSCCEPYLSGSAEPPTAEALMRSRYTAYVKTNIDYIRDTYDPKLRHEFDDVSARKWSKESKWLGLKILSTEAGRESDVNGKIEFIAKYSVDGSAQEYHEIAEFRKDKKWYFVDGVIPKIAPIVRQEEKIGRNDPCKCGSGKKFKKCCGV